jgi:hypothetical protein
MLPYLAAGRAALGCFINDRHDDPPVIMKPEDFKRIACAKCVHEKTCKETCRAGELLIKLSTGVHEGYTRIKNELADLYK